MVWKRKFMSRKKRNYCWGLMPRGGPAQPASAFGSTRGRSGGVLSHKGSDPMWLMTRQVGNVAVCFPITEAARSFTFMFRTY